MKIDKGLSDTEILVEMGRRIKACRIRKEMTQAEFATLAGVSKGTVSNAEKGESIQIGSLLKILRELDFVNSLETILPVDEQSPMQLIRTKNEKSRQRVRKSRQLNGNYDSEWKWGDMNED